MFFNLIRIQLQLTSRRSHNVDSRADAHQELFHLQNVMRINQRLQKRAATRIERGNLTFAVLLCKK